MNSTIVGDVTFAASAAGRATSRQTVDQYFFNPAAANSGTTAGDVHTELGPVRCDDAAPGEGNGGNGTPGCVMVYKPGVFRINAPGCVGKGCIEHRAFAARAQANPYTQHWGVVGSAKPLTLERLPGWDNTQGGLQLQDFYRVNHILDGDPFYVVP